jgi:hypothetical protein
MRIDRLTPCCLLLIWFAESACQDPQDSSELRAELRGESARMGLALARAEGWYIAVVPFDSDAKYFKTGQAFQLMTFGTSGRAIVWEYRRSFLEPDEFLINATNGAKLGTIRRLGPRGASEFHPLALHEASGRVAFSGRLQGGQSPRGLHWAALDFSQREFISEGRHCDWSPDGNALVYESQDKIWLFDIVSNSSKVLGPGHDPAWSPNGAWIGYRSPEGHASLMTVKGVPISWPLGAHEPAGPLHWSPNGRFVSFAERTSGIHIPFLTADYRLLACRAGDGKCLTVQKFGSYTGPPNDFHWILGYQKFCGTCITVQPFN